MEEQIKVKIKAIFPNEVDQKFDTLTKWTKINRNNYKQIKGYNPSENFLTALFINELGLSEVPSSNEEEDTFLLDTICFPKIKKAISGIITRSEPATFTLLTPYRIIGSDGCGGTFYTSFSDREALLYHHTEEFDGLEVADLGLLDIINAQGDLVKSLYTDLLKYHEDWIAQFIPSEQTPNDLLFPLEDVMDLTVGISLLNSSYLEQDFHCDLSIAYFDGMLNEEQSDYNKYDNVIPIVNGQLTAFMYILYFTGEMESLDQLISCLKKVKGEEIKAFIHFFRRLIKAQSVFKTRVHPQSPAQ